MDEEEGVQCHLGDVWKGTQTLRGGVLFVVQIHVGTAQLSWWRRDRGTLPSAAQLSFIWSGSL